MPTITTTAPATSTLTETFRTKVAAFGPVRRHYIEVASGTVRVWDPVARYFTACHRLSPKVCRRLAIRVGSTKISVVDGTDDLDRQYGHVTDAVRRVRVPRGSRIVR